MSALPADLVVLGAAAILFDNDGVLSDSTATVDAAWRRFAANHDLDAGPMIPFVHGRPARGSIELRAPHLDIDAAVTELEDLEVAAAPDVRPIAGALALVRSLAAHRWIVVTSGSRRLASARLGAIGIHPPAMVTADDVVEGKPHPEPYLAAAAALGVDAADCVVLEDTEPGVTAARAAGAITIGVVGDSGRHIGAHHHVRDLTQLRTEMSGDRLLITIVQPAP